MNKKFILPISLVLLVGLAVFVSAYYRPSSYDASDNSVTFNIPKAGWYVIPFASPNNQDCVNKGSIKAVWIWSPTSKKYIGGKYDGQISSEDRAQFESDKSSKYLYSLENFGGGWVYFSKPCEYKVRFSPYSPGTGEFESTLGQLKLIKGWNFFVVNPAYDGKSLNDLKGDCNIIQTAAWDADTQNWMNTNLNTALSEKLQKSFSGEHLLVKVSETCTMGLASSTSEQPPTIPN